MTSAAAPRQGRHGTAASGEVESRLASLGLHLPTVAKPIASYIPGTRTGNLVFCSGQLNFRDGKLTATGKVGRELTLEQGQEAAKVAALNCLAIVKDQVGDLDKVVKVVRLVGHVAVAPGFTDVSKVVNGASDVIVQVLGDKGKHTRLALGAAELPMGAPIEVELIAEVKP